MNYESTAGTGRWIFKKFDDFPVNNSLGQIANIDICYAVGSTRFSYEARRSFFRKTAIEIWCKKTFVGYETTLRAALINDDPSFLVKLRRPGCGE